MRCRHSAICTGHVIGRRRPSLQTSPRHSSPTDSIIHLNYSNSLALEITKQRFIMTRIKAPSALPDLVKSAFAKARSEGDLHYYPTQVTVLKANNIPVSPCQRSLLSPAFSGRWNTR